VSNVTGTVAEFEPAPAPVAVTPRSYQTRSDVQLDCQPVSHDEFDKIAVGFADVVQEQTAVFLGERWGHQRIETFALRADQKLFGAAAVLIIKNPVVGGGMAIVKWGPLWRLLGEPANEINLWQSIKALQDEFVTKRGFHLTIMPHADPDFGDTTINALTDLGFSAGKSLKSPDRYLVNVDQTDEELKASFEQKWRYNLKKSLQNPLEIEHIDAGEGYDRFMNLYTQMLERKKFHETSAVHTLPHLIEAKVKELKPLCLMVKSEGTDTAGAMIDISGERAVYLYGATDDRALPLKAGYAMQWSIVQLLCAQPLVRWYDLGGADGDKGLHQFKKGFVGKSGEIVVTPAGYVSCQSIVSNLFSHAIYTLRGLKASVHKVMHKAAG
jgi:lipid II:glycine glycyltransferase (peptidoglycan interpeptide bridge formation enzyme)